MNYIESVFKVYSSVRLLHIFEDWSFYQVNDGWLQKDSSSYNNVDFFNVFLVRFYSW